MTVPVWMLLGFATGQRCCCFSRLGFIAGAASSADACRSGIFRLTPLGGGLVSARDAGPRELHRKSADFRRDCLWTLRW